MKNSGEKGPAKTDALTATAENELLRRALNNFIELKKNTVPESILTQARALYSTPKTDLLKFNDVPLELRVCLVQKGLIVPEKFIDQYHQLLWKQHRQLARIIKSGEVSSHIWISFKLFQEPQQQQGLKKYPTFSRYNQMLELLESIQASLGTGNQTELHQRQEALANFVKQHRKFISRQLQFDKALREKFLLSLTHAYNKDLEPLFQLIALTPALAKEFEELMDVVIKQQYDIVEEPGEADEHPDQTAAKKLLLRRYLKTCLNGDTIASALLDNPDEFTADFITKVLLRRRGAVKEYRANLESTVWQFANAFKAFLQLLAPSLAKFLFTTPAIGDDLIHSLSTEIEILSKEPYVLNDSGTTYQTSFSVLRRKDDSFSENEEPVTPLERSRPNVSVVDKDGTYYTPIHSELEGNVTLDTPVTIEGKKGKKSSQEDQGLSEPEVPHTANMTLE